MKLCFTSASRWFSLKLPFLVHWEQPREKPCWAFPSGTTGEGAFLSPRHSGAPCSSWCLAWGVLLLPWWWVRRFGFTPWDRKLGTTDVLNSPLTPRKVVMTLALVILCLQLIYVLLIPWLPEMEAYAAASGQM